MNQITLIALGLILCLLGGMLMHIFLKLVNTIMDDPAANSSRYEVVIVVLALLIMGTTYLIINNL